MKVKNISDKLLQDKLKPDIYYEPGKEYKVEAETAKRLIASGNFEEVIEEAKEIKEVKEIKKEGK